MILESMKFIYLNDGMDTKSNDDLSNFQFVNLAFDFFLFFFLIVFYVLTRVVCVT